MKQLVFTLILCFTISIFSADAQSGFKVPENYSMKKKKDYEKYENDVLAAIDWLEKTPIIEQENKRRDVNAFLLTWITGTPKVTMTLNVYATKFADPNADAMLMFMAGWSKFILQNPGKAKDQKAGELAGIRMVLNVYKGNNGYSKNETIEAALKAEEKGELEKWLEEQTAKK